MENYHLCRCSEISQMSVRLSPPPTMESTGADSTSPQNPAEGKEEMRRPEEEKGMSVNASLSVTRYRKDFSALRHRNSSSFALWMGGVEKVVGGGRKSMKLLAFCGSVQAKNQPFFFHSLAVVNRTCPFPFHESQNPFLLLGSSSCRRRGLRLFETGWAACESHFMPQK